MNLNVWRDFQICISVPLIEWVLTHYEIKKQPPIITAALPSLIFTLKQ